MSTILPRTATSSAPLTPRRPEEQQNTGSAVQSQTSVPSGTAEVGNDRIISGIDLIDYGAGGLYPEKVYLVKGGPGTGKTIVGLQFLSRGLELHEPGLLVTDQRPHDLVAQAESLGFPIELSVKRGQLQILNPSKRYFELVESPADVMAIVEEMGDYIKKVGARRLVIDPVYTLINTSYSSHFALSITQSLINALEELPVTTLLIVGDDRNAELNPIIRMLEQNAFGMVELTPDRATGGRLMQLSKLRYASTDDLSAHYRILDGRGLINYRGEGEHVSDVTKPWEDATEVRRSVLVLGSNPETIRKAKEALGKSYEVSAESDLKRGLERARTEKPGLVLVTPSRSGQAVSVITELARNSDSSVAFLSPSSNRASDKVFYLRAGADDFITEPFSPSEFRARVDALIRRSGRRLNVRDSSIQSITLDELSGMNEERPPRTDRSREVLKVTENRVELDPEFKDRLQRNIDTVSKFDTNFVLYWIKAREKNPELNRALAKLCRQEDIICHNVNGEFLALLTGIDENGVRGFETRLEEKLGNLLQQDNVRRGFTVYRPGERSEDVAGRLTPTRP